MIVFKVYPEFVMGTISASLVCYIPASFIFSNTYLRNLFSSLFKHKCSTILKSSKITNKKKVSATDWFCFVTCMILFSLGMGISSIK